MKHLVTFVALKNPAQTNSSTVNTRHVSVIYFSQPSQLCLKESPTVTQAYQLATNIKDTILEKDGWLLKWEWDLINNNIIMYLPPDLPSLFYKKKLHFVMGYEQMSKCFWEQNFFWVNRFCVSVEGRLLVVHYVVVFLCYSLFPNPIPQKEKIIIKKIYIYINRPCKKKGNAIKLFTDSFTNCSWAYVVKSLVQLCILTKCWNSFNPCFWMIKPFGVFGTFHNFYHLQFP